MKKKMAGAAHRKVLFIILFCIVFASLSACSGGTSQGTKDPDPPTPPNPPANPVINKAIALERYNNCDDLLAKIKKDAIAEMDEMLNETDWCAGYATLASPTSGDSGSNASSESGADFTGTNTQEKGVDEADLIKTDGKYTYAIINSELRIYKVWPFAEFKEIAKVSLDDDPVGLYLSGNRLIVILRGQTANYEQTAIQKIYDVKDPQKPIEVSSRTITGAYLDSRLISSDLHVVTMSSLNTIPLSYPEYNKIECEEVDGKMVPSSKTKEYFSSLKTKNSETINKITLSDVLPNINNDSCQNILGNSLSGSNALLSVTSSDISKDDSSTYTTTIIGNGGSVYSSTNSIYIASSTTSSIFENFGSEEATIVHRFSLEGNSSAYIASNAIEGHLLDNSYVGAGYSQNFSMASFAMSEFENVLRVATTIGHVSRDDNSSTNLVSTLDSNMNIIGKVSDLGKGERIYAVRFIGDRGYVVTFKKVDPLYVLDLADPTKPSIAGELKIPGFSSYLHPMDEDHIIGLGYGADDQGDFAWVQGLKLAIFDVKDPSNPKEVQSLEIGTRGSYSTAIEEHHAFTFDPDTNLIAIPADLYEGTSGGSSIGTAAFSGVVMTSATPSGFGTVQKIGVSTSQGEYNYGWGNPTVLRTVIMKGDNQKALLILTATDLEMKMIDTL